MFGFPFTRRERRQHWTLCRVHSNHSNQATFTSHHEGGLVLDVEIARQRQGRLALDLVAEDHDRRQVVADLQLVKGEQDARRWAEVAPAGRAAEPRRSVGSRAGPARWAAALRAHWNPIGLRPAD